MNINTVNTKAAQLANGYFKIDSGNEWILVIGSCRAVPYLNYFHDWNIANNNRFTICFIDPYNFNYDLQDNRVDLEATIISLETDARILELLKRTNIIIHEYYSNFGMFNFDKTAPKNIYQFGLSPTMDICLPNWNDKFVMFADIVTFDIEIRKRAIADYNVLNKLSKETEKAIQEISTENVRKFLNVCYLADMPEMSDYFQQNWMEKRFYWNSNHVSKHFTLAIFNFINKKWFNSELSVDESHVDMYANNYTKLTEYDLAYYPNMNWGEEVIELKSKLF